MSAIVYLATHDEMQIKMPVGLAMYMTLTTKKEQEKIKSHLTVLLDAEEDEESQLTHHNDHNLLNFSPTVLRWIKECNVLHTR
tara:strand:+ start:230 stop:478 length:249 start_codon:yes stop_codon:yes gene_type:complete